VPVPLPPKELHPREVLTHREGTNPSSGPLIVQPTIIDA